MKSMSHPALSDSVSDIESVVTMIDTLAGSIPGNKARVGEDLVAIANQLILSNKYSSHGSVDNGFDLVSTATSRIKRPRIEV